MTAKLIKVNGQEFLEIQIAITKRPSASGKTTVVASTNGNKAIPVEIDGKAVILGVNAYIPRG